LKERRGSKALKESKVPLVRMVLEVSVVYKAKLEKLATLDLEEQRATLDLEVYKVRLVPME
jgi:hypothetical protein